MGGGVVGGGEGLQLVEAGVGVEQGAVVVLGELDGIEDGAERLVRRGLDGLSGEAVGGDAAQEVEQGG